MYYYVYLGNFYQIKLKTRSIKKRYKHIGPSRRQLILQQIHARQHRAHRPQSDRDASRLRADQLRQRPRAHEAQEPGSGRVQDRRHQERLQHQLAQLIRQPKDSIQTRRDKPHRQTQGLPALPQRPHHSSMRAHRLREQDAPRKLPESQIQSR